MSETKFDEFPEPPSFDDKEPDPLDPNRPLDLFEQIFVEGNLAGLSYAKAYLAAYGESDRPYRITQVLAFKIAQRPAVAKALRAARMEARARVNREIAQERKQLLSMEEYAISKENIARSLSALAWNDPRSFMEWGPDGVSIRPSDELTAAQAYAVVQVTQRTSKDGDVTVTIKLADKIKALNALSQLCGFLDPEPEAVPDAPDEERRRRTKEYLMRRLAEMARPEPLTINQEAEPVWAVPQKDGA